MTFADLKVGTTFYFKAFGNELPFVKYSASAFGWKGTMQEAEEMVTREVIDLGEGWVEPTCATCKQAFSVGWWCEKCNKGMQ